MWIQITSLLLFKYSTVSVQIINILLYVDNARRKGKSNRHYQFFIIC